MYSKKIAFTDFDGNKREQTFYFNLSKAELTEMNLNKEGGIKAYVERIINANNVPELAELFKSLILMSYGEKSDDGMRFIKKHPARGRLADEFEQTDAYSELFMELATNDVAAAEFINGVIPSQLREQLPSDAGHAYPPQISKN